MTYPSNNAAIIIQENVEEDKKDDVKKAYKNLNEKCDVVLEKIKKRKTRQAKK